MFENIIIFVNLLLHVYTYQYIFFIFSPTNLYYNTIIWFNLNLGIGLYKISTRVCVGIDNIALLQ